MTKKTTEKRSFAMHPNLLYDVITKQAGSLQKAILEGVMNGVDAGASRIDVDLDAKRLRIVDDGKGFAGREEIENFFETFGTPHVEGDATYGRFRMGRGQLMAFGANTWRTNVFRMRVDIKVKGLDYDLETLDESAPGCSITVDLYKSLLPSERDNVQREIREWVAYVSIPVFFNGVRISADPKEAKWTVETDDAYFKLSATAPKLLVYNLGVRVMEQSAYHHGVGGVVVSKKRLDVNFARNDVQSDCGVFKGIKKELRKHADRATKTKRKLTDAERQHIALRIASRDIEWKEGYEAPVLTDIEGKHLSLQKLSQKLYHAGDILTAAKGDRTAIKVANQGMALALSDETLQRFDVEDVKSLIDAVRGFCLHHEGVENTDRWRARNLNEGLLRLKPTKLDDYRHLVNATYETLDKKELTGHRRTLLAAVQHGANVVAGILDKQQRRIIAGRSEIARGWTDGVTAIWIETDQLPMLAAGYKGAARMAALIVHEYMHEGPDTETHEHDVEFYERFHDTTLDTEVIGKTAGAMVKHLAEAARRQGNKPGVSALLFEDMEERIRNAGGQGSDEVPFEEPRTIDASQDRQASLPLGRAA